MTMQKVKELRVTIENRPGTLARIASALSEAKVNIEAFLAGPGGSEGYVDLLVDNINQAKKVLQQEGLSYTEHEVLRVELPNVPGTLAALAGKLAAKNINIGWGYSVVPTESRKAAVILAVSDIDIAARIRL
jgi:hypothetical protein